MPSSGSSLSSSIGSRKKPEIDLASLAEQFDTDGFCLAESVIPPEDVQSVIPRMDALIAGDYETGVPPHSGFRPGDPTDRLIKIDQPHLSDHMVRSFVSHPEIGRCAAEATGAGWVQPWAVQLLVKPSGSGSGGHIGFHQDT